MAGILDRGCNEPMPRYLHTAWQAGTKSLVHGGRIKDYWENTKRRLASVVEVFDAYTESWQQQEVTGEPPTPGVYGAASASFDGDTFTFGGQDGSRRYNALHKLKSGSQWIELCPHNEKNECPMAKTGAGMVAFGDNLAIIGGYGIPHGPIQPGSSFIRNTGCTDGRGWTNEFHIYSLKDDVWISPDITGERPPPCSDFTLTPISNRRAVLFGGGNGRGLMNDVYIIDLLTMHWTKLYKSGDGPWPEERSYHAACCLNYGQQHPQLLVTRGLSRQGKVLRDAWILDVDSVRWRKVSGTLQPRWAHSTTAFSLVDGVTEVTMFGGSTDPPAESWEKQSKLADTTLLQFCHSRQSEWELDSVTQSSKLGSEERVSMKKIRREERERQMEKRLQRAEERLKHEREKFQRAKVIAQQAEERVQQEKERVQRAEVIAQQAKERKKEDRNVLEQQVRQAEARTNDLQRRLEEERREHERMLQQTMERAKQAEERIQQEKERVQRAEVMAQQAEKQQEERDALEQQVRQAEARANDLQRRLEEERRKHEMMLQQAMERAQQAEEKVQQEKERAQRVEVMPQQAEKEQKDRESLEQQVRQAEARAEELQRKLNEEGLEHERKLQQTMERSQQAEMKVQQEWTRVQRAEVMAYQAKEREQEDREALGQRVQQAEARADELQRRLDEERRGHERLAAQLKEREMMLQQAIDGAQQAQVGAQHERERAQRAEERVQQEKELVQRVKVMAQQAEEREQEHRRALEQQIGQAEARANELQRRLDEVEGRERGMLVIQQRGAYWTMREEERKALQTDERGQQNREALETMVWRSDKVESREPERVTDQKQEGESIQQERWGQQAGAEIQGLEGTEQQESERSQPAEWQIQQAELLLEVAEVRANSLQWRLSMIEGREQERLALQQTKREMHLASERAQQTEERVQRAEERIQQERETTHLAQWKVQQAEFLAQLAEARATSLQWRVGMVEEREQEKLAVDQLKEELKQVGERAQKAEERIQSAEERVQRLAIAAEQRPVFIRGADIVAKTTLEVVPGTPLTFEWMGHGMKLYMPADALKSDLPTQIMTIQASLSGQYQFPDDTELVSGIYWVAFPHRFSRPVTLELQHCAYLEHPDQLSSLSFLSAKCNQKTLPYQFQPLPGGVFSTNTSYGAIELSHFSGFGVARRKGKRKRYTGQIYYIPQAAITTWLMHFTIICDLKLCLKEVKRFYSGKGAEAGPYLEVIFDGEEVSLDIPIDGITLPSGWSLRPLVYPAKLLRESVDNYQPGHLIPACQVQLVWSKVEEPPKELSYMIRVTGVIPHDTHIGVLRNPVFHVTHMDQSHAETGDKSGSEHKDISLLAETERLDDDFLTLLMPILCRSSVPSKWKLFGVLLKVPPSSLNIIEAKHPHNPQQGLMEMLELWQKRMNPPPSWDAVIEALQDLEEEQLATKLADKYKPQD